MSHLAIGRKVVEGGAHAYVEKPFTVNMLKRYRRQMKAIPFVPMPCAVLRAIAHLNVWYSGRTQGHLPAVFTPYKVDAVWKGHRFSNARATRALGWASRVSMSEALDRSFCATVLTPSRS